MKHVAATMLLGAFLLGCGGTNPLATDVDTDGDGTDGTVDPVPAAIAGNVGNVVFDADAGTLVVEGVDLDSVPFSTTYDRAPQLDQNGYIAFTAQDDPLDRHFTAYAQQSGNVSATVISSPSPRNRSLIGVDFSRDGDFEAPDASLTTGQVSYAGSYIGLTNLGDPNGPDLLSTSVTPSDLQPGQALIVQGDVFLNADFADNSVEGNIFNRELLNTDLSTNSDLPSLVLVLTSVDDEGTFSGGVEYEIGDPLSGTTTQTNIGSYAGIFGGPDAQNVAGGISIDQFDGVGDNLGLENELESGIFVLDQCGPGNPSPVCNQIP